MKKFLLAFLLGVLVASMIWVGLLLTTQKASEDRSALETLDYAIDEWAAQRSDEVAIAALGFPGAKVGYIPDTVYVLAHRVDSLYHVPEGVVIAQWILESRFGTRDLGANNFFGHTLAAVKPWMTEPRFVWRRDKVMKDGVITIGPPVRFAQYTDIAECLDVHGKYLSQSGRYRHAFSTSSPEAFARQLSKCGYATDPDYGLKLIVIMRRYKL